MMAKTEINFRLLAFYHNDIRRLRQNSTCGVACSATLGVVMFEEDVTYIDARDLLELMKMNKQSITVIDVRTDDYNEGGHIAGGTNIPVDEWDDDNTTEHIVKSHVLAKVDVVIFHCTYSQQRGPFSAKRYSAAKSRMFDDNNGLPRVMILRGGYKAWKAHSISLGVEGESMIQN